MAHVSDRKKQTVQLLQQKIKEYPIIGVLNMEELPGKNLGKMRKKLRPEVEIVMAKKRLMHIAFKEADKDVQQLEEYFTGMPALLFTKENPFTLFKRLKKNQSPAPIKPGQETPIDIVIPAGPTQFPPGPMIGELGQFGIKTAVEDGKIAIKKDAKVAKQGDVIDDKKAGLLARFGIEPMRVGLSLIAVYEDGEVLTKDVLNIDEDAFMQDLRSAIGRAIGLASGITWTTKENITSFLAQAHASGLALARSQDILTSDTVGEILAKASSQATALQALVPDAPAEETPAESEETQEEKATEPTEETPEKPEEAPAEESSEEASVEAPEQEESAETAEPKDAQEKEQEKTPGAPTEESDEDASAAQEEPPAEEPEKKEDAPAEEPEEKTEEKSEEPAEESADAQTAEADPENESTKDDA